MGEKPCQSDIGLFSKYYKEASSIQLPDNWNAPDRLEALCRPRTTPPCRILRRPSSLVGSFEMDGKRHLSFGVPYDKLSDGWKQVYKEGLLVLPPMTEAEIAYTNQKKFGFAKMENLHNHALEKGLAVEKSREEEELEVASSEAKEAEEEDKMSNTVSVCDKNLNGMYG